ncbi:MAG: preprotein translocase subunit SecE [Clostridiales bacterium]|nr:preprotein translocase subunit SecE [Clostridiales bacterium]
MAEEKKTNLDEEVNDAEETVSPDTAKEVEEGDSLTEETEAPVKKKDRSKIYLDSKQTNAKKKKEPGKVRRWFKDFFSELKKVTWPSFSKVLKQTGTVLLVTVIFLLVLMAFDSLFGWLYRLGISNIQDTSEAVGALASMLKGGGGLL